MEGIPKFLRNIVEVQVGIAKVTAIKYQVLTRE
jgi:hypothetical protein